jgi:glutamyl-tRNA synthetase
MTVRVRIAPSPTGSLHVGNARSALFNWLFARHNGGVFILRIDDTDEERSTAEYEVDILDSLRWLGLDWDEGVVQGGPHGSYRQSDRHGRYRGVAEGLVEAGVAYYDDRGPDELDSLRRRAQKEGRHPGHYVRRPEVEADSGVIRFSVPQDDAIEFEDAVRGTMRFEPQSVDDFVILRSNGTPTYHLASTVDDVDYQITHVIRGEDVLPSTPKHIVLTRALGAEVPTYAHLPLLFGLDGKKLSKRHGETALSHYREAGYLPEAVFNYLSLLGWSLDGETTIFSRAQAVEAFDLADVSHNPAAFDPDKLAWMNGEYIRAMSLADFVSAVRPHVEAAVGRPLESRDWVTFEQVAELVQERTRLLPEAGEQVVFLFNEIDQYDTASWDKVMAKEGVSGVLDEARLALSDINVWATDAIEEVLRAMVRGLGIGLGKGLQPIRVAVTGSSVSPPLFESLAALGRERSLERIAQARALLD